MDVSYEKTVKKLQENFSRYKNFRRKCVFDLHQELIECRNEADCYLAQGDQWSLNEVQKSIKRTEDTIQQHKDLSQYAREPTIEDYVYRHKQYDNFSKTI